MTAPTTRPKTYGGGLISGEEIRSSVLDGHHPKAFTGFTQMGLPILVQFQTVSGTSSYNFTMPRKCKVIDMWAVQNAAGGAADTAKLTDGTNDITNALDLNKSDKVVTRVGTIDDAYSTIAKDGTLNVTTASDATADIFVLLIPINY